MDILDETLVTLGLYVLAFMEQDEPQIVNILNTIDETEYEAAVFLAKENAAVWGDVLKKYGEENPDMTSFMDVDGNLKIDVVLDSLSFLAFLRLENKNVFEVA